jgi:cysteine-rich repeat protein
MIITALIAFSSLVLPTQFEGVPLEWSCSPFQYGTGDGCDCGCGVVDPDCTFGDPAQRDSCDDDGCAVDEVPNNGDPSRCVANVCGDGYVGGTEACDDGIGGGDDDGCVDDCSAIRAGFRCSKVGGGCAAPGCGDRFVEPFRDEQCDDGNDVAGDGCDACVAEVGYVCFTFQPCLPTTCGNLSVEIDFETRTGEACDDGNNNPNDGCHECQAQPGFICNPFDGFCQQQICGNNNLEQDPIGRGEECDDGGRVPGDGCDADCRAEDGFVCDFGGCRPVVCGDGVIAFPVEGCDDGNTDSNDGCAGDCSTFEPGFFCPREGSTCTPIVCGDGRIERDVFGNGEVCDDQNNDAGDGCFNCQGEPGAICDERGCRFPVCGDGIVEPFDRGGSEACDDGNDVDGDGCPADCSFVEAGFFCAAGGEPCVRVVCGDGTVFGDETCDDGNDDAGDGCSDVCVREDNFVCRTPGQPCEPLPSDWQCSLFTYGTDDGCDCGCGLPDPDCGDTFGVRDCDFNQCLGDAPFVDADDPTQCSTTPPPAEGEGEGEGEGGEGEGEPSLSGGGCGSCASGATPLTAVLALLLRRRRR